MVGRKRRASTSSVESVDESQIRWRQETSVLRTVPKELSSDDWPIFELRDAIVLNRDGQTIENALHVDIRGPFIVRGHLVIDDASQKSHLIMRVRKSLPLEIRQCVSYSIGESPDGSPLVWVSGRGGWYEINPSPAYRAMYRKMCEATTLYYTLVDIYNSKRPPHKIKKTKQSSLMDELSAVFLQYAARIGDGSTFDEVIARCNEHAGFFICQFAQYETLIDWQPTAFYKWLMSEHSVRVIDAQNARSDANYKQELAQQVQKSIRNSRRHSPVPTAEALSPMPRGNATRSATRSSSVEQTEAKNVAPKRSARKASSLAPPPVVREPPPVAEETEPQLTPQPKPAEPSPGPLSQPANPPAGDDASSFASVVNALEDVYKSLAQSKKGLTITRVLNKLYFSYRFVNYRDGTKGSHLIPVVEVLHYNAAALLRELDRSQYEGHEFYSYLEDLAKTEFRPIAFKPSDFPMVITPRKKMTRSKKEVQPLPAVGSKAPKGGGETRGEARDGETNTTPGRGSKGIKRHGRGKKSSLRPAVFNKRAHSELESDESDASVPKQSHDVSDGDEVMEDAPEVEPHAEQAASARDDDGDSSPAEPAENGKKPITIVIRAERLPSTAPQPSNGAWTCDEDGCDYIVRGGDKQECQARIRAHFHDHEQQLERVSLAVMESRGLLPINHLLDKIKRMGERQSTSAGGTPPPIKRKLIV